MCGIAGIWDFTSKNPTESLLRKMAQALSHRGPDGEGLYLADNVGLAHRRLAILDLSEAGHQPMQSKDQTCWIVFNGEIYNFVELRQRLRSLGHSFRSDTDTEVILAAYQEWGPDCVKQFNGMWAFAIWDTVRQRMFCSRDRFGVKPFYYHLTPHLFIFASEAKVLLQHPEVPNHVNEQSLYNFLGIQKSDMGQPTFWKDINQLKPGHNLLLDKNGLKEDLYWSLQGSPRQDANEQELSRQLLDLFTDSVRLRFRSDVPVGSCLSGGLDSSSIVCVAHQIRSELNQNLYDQETFSACYHERETDEREFIEKVLKATEARKNYVFPTAEGLLADLEKLVDSQGEPFPTLSIYSQWCVMQKVKETPVKVLLDGQGSDEMLAGYGYDSLYWAELREQRAWSYLWQEWKASLQVSSKTFLRSLPRFLSPELVYSLERKRPNNPWLDHDFTKQHHADLFQKFYPKKDFSGRMQDLSAHLMQNNLPALLRYEDRNSMAFSLEARLPFLDYRLVEFLFQLPSTVLIHKGWSKWILRNAMQGILPSEIQWRRDKKGFPAPQSKWFAQPLAPLIKEVVWSDSFQQRPYWNGRSIAHAFDRFLTGQDTSIGMRLWPFISAELWLQRFIDQRPSF